MGDIPGEEEEKKCGKIISEKRSQFSSSISSSNQSTRGDMHSATSILAQANLLDSTPKIIDSYWKDEHVKRQPFMQMLLNGLTGRFANKTIIEYADRKQICTYQQLSVSIRKAANLLREVPPNQYILFIGQNSIKYLSLYFGSIFNGSIPFNLPQVNYSLQNIQTLLILHRVQYLVVDGGFNSGWLQKILNSVTTIEKVFLHSPRESAGSNRISHEKLVYLPDWLDSCFNDNGDDNGNDQEDGIKAKPIEELYVPRDLTSKPCLAVNSNGATEWPPKLCLYNDYSLVATSQLIADGKIFEIRPVDSIMAYGSFEHLENLLMFLVAIMNGCVMILVPRFDYNQIIDAICKYRINMAILPSNFLVKLLKDSNHQLSLDGLYKIIAFGGRISSRLCENIFRRFLNIKSIRHCYVMAETPCPITMMVRNSRDYETIGYPLPNTRVKIINMFNNDYEMLEANRSGYICIQREKPMFALGYLHYNRQDLSDLNFQNCPKTDNHEDVDGWLHGQQQQQEQQKPKPEPEPCWLITTDIGFYDENGLVCLHGQFRDPVYNMNALLYQSKIEAVLLQHPLIAEAYIMEVGAKQFATLVSLKFVNTYLTAKLHKQIVNFVLDSNNWLEKFSLFVKYNLPKANTGRYIDSLMRKQIVNLINIQEKF